MKVVAGSTNVTTYHYIVGDAGHASPGDPVAGLLFSNIETGGSASYARAGAARTDLTLVTQTAAGAHTDGGFVLVDDTNMIGVYRCDWPDAAFAVGVGEVILYLNIATASNAVTAPIKVELTDPVNDLFKSTAIDSGSTSTAVIAAFGGYAASELVGELVWILDTGATEWHPAWVTAFATTSGTFTLESARDGGVMPFTIAATDRLWRSGFTRAQLTAVSVSGSVGSVTGAVGSVTGAVGSVTGHTAQTGDNYARLGAPAGASVSADVAAVKVDTAAILVDTADIQPKIGTPAADIAADIAAAKVDTAAIKVVTDTLARFGVVMITGTTSGTPTQTVVDFTSLSHTVTTNELRGRTVLFADGTGGSQGARIVSNTASQFTMTSCTTAPATALAFLII